MKHVSNHNRREILPAMQKTLFCFYWFYFSFATAQIYQRHQLDKKPSYKNGTEEEMRAFLTKSAQTPDDYAQRAIFLRLIIDSSGHPTPEFVYEHSAELEDEAKRLVGLLEFVPAEIKGKKVACYHDLYIDMTKEKYYEYRREITKQNRQNRANAIQRGLDPDKMHHPLHPVWESLGFLILCMAPPIIVLIGSIIVIVKGVNKKKQGNFFGLGPVVLKIILLGALSSGICSLLIFNTPLSRAMDGSGNFAGFLVYISIGFTVFLVLLFIIIASFASVPRK